MSPAPWVPRLALDIGTRSACRHDAVCRLQPGRCLVNPRAHRRACLIPESGVASLRALHWSCGFSRLLACLLDAQSFPQPKDAPDGGMPVRVCSIDCAAGSVRCKACSPVGATWTATCNEIRARAARHILPISCFLFSCVRAGRPRGPERDPGRAVNHRGSRPPLRREFRGLVRDASVLSESHWNRRAAVKSSTSTGIWE